MMMMMPTKRAAVVAMLGLQMMMTLPAIRGDPGVHTCCTKCCAPQSGGPPFPPDICNEELNTCWDMARTLAYYVCDNGEWCGRPGGIRDPSLPYYNWCCMYEPGENIPDWTGTPARDKCNNPTAHPPTCFNVVNNFHHFFNEICEDNQGEKDYTDQYPTFGILGHLQGEPCGCDGFCGGEPHFKTWKGDWYDYHGECSLIFLDAPDFGGGLGLKIHIRTKIRYDYSYIESAVVKIGPEDTLEVNSWGSYIVNGVQQADLATSAIRMADSFPISYQPVGDKEHRFEIRFNEQEHLQLNTFKDMVGIKVEGATFASFGTSRGLMGTFGSGNPMARNGTTVFSLDDPNAFAEDWQVRDTDEQLFQAVVGPQYPERCVLPDPSQKEARRRRLGESAVTQDAAEAACADWDNKDACVYDIMATGDLELAQSTPY